MKITHSIYTFALIGASFGMVSCGASGEDPGYEFAPQMYNSIPYEPLTQIVNEDEGSWLSTREDGRGEFYNSNINNPNRMNMREPVANTVPRSKDGSLPYRLKQFELEAAAVIENPLEFTPQVLAEGKVLYTQYCSTCHGQGGEGDGKAGEIIGGVANLKGGAYINLPEGHIFHVIIKGKGRMLPHGSQVSQERAWKIVHYVKQEIQKQ